MPRKTSTKTVDYKPTAAQMVGNTGDKAEGPTWDSLGDHLAYNALDGTPWHEMGTPVHGAMTTAEAIKAAGLDWEVVLRPVGVRIHKNFVTLADRWGVVREDTEDVFLVSSKKYTPIQNSKAFETVDQIVGEGKALINTAGYLGHGRKVWIQLELPQNTFEPVKGDVVRDFLLFMNAHDGSSSARMGRTPIRAVCANTLNRAISQFRGDKTSFRTTHLGDVNGRLDIAAGEIRKEIDWFASWKEEVGEMVKAKFDAADAEQFVLDMVQANKIRQHKGEYKAATKISDLWERQRLIGEDLMRLVESGKGTDIPGVAGTGWGLYNAVTEYVDHHSLTDPRGPKVDLPMADRRINYMLYGDGAKMKERARMWVLEGREAALSLAI